jgi:hypothetical protein
VQEIVHRIEQPTLCRKSYTESNGDSFAKSQENISLAGSMRGGGYPHLGPSKVSELLIYSKESDSDYASLEAETLQRTFYPVNQTPG